MDNELDKLKDLISGGNFILANIMSHASEQTRQLRTHLIKSVQNYFHNILSEWFKDETNREHFRSINWELARDYEINDKTSSDKNETLTQSLLVKWLEYVRAKEFLLNKIIDQLDEIINKRKNKDEKEYIDIKNQIFFLFFDLLLGHNFLKTDEDISEFFNVEGSVCFRVTSMLDKYTCLDKCLPLNINVIFDLNIDTKIVFTYLFYYEKDTIENSQIYIELN